MAVGTAPGWLASLKDETLLAGVARLKSYLQTTAPLHDYSRVLLLWTSTRMPDLLTDNKKAELIETIFKHQRADGGWSIRTFAAPEAWGKGNRAQKLREEPEFADVVGRMLTAYAVRLQREDGLFIHGVDGPHAWGRGNGFAALGLTEALTYMEGALAERDAILASYQRLMEALLPLQTADGAWRNVLDQPTAYPELTVTAIMLTAMARGVRLGWLDGERYMPAIERAWGAVLARVGEDGSVRDVCTSTGAQATLEYYMTRPVVNGADDRGGAIVLMAALEMDMLARQPM